ncbi:MAG TPA: ABC transporter substrate-binding protein [Candidatus Limnocylindrales bacterium]
MIIRRHPRLPSIVLSLVMMAGAGLVAGCGAAEGGTPTKLTLGFSAWPGWLPWQVAKEKGLFAKHGVDVELKFYGNYTSSLLALETGALDANSQTLNDTLIAVANGAKQKIVLVNDNSTGNDKIIAHEGIRSIAELKGRKVSVEPGTADHYLLLLALRQAGLGPKDVVMEAHSAEAGANAFHSGTVDAVSVSTPFTTKALQRPGSHAVATSAEFPGAIPNHLVVRPQLVTEHPEAVQGLVNAWFDTMRWIRENRDEANQIMATVGNVDVEALKTYAAGTTIFTQRQVLDAFTPGTNPKHLNYQAAQIADFILGIGMIQSRPNMAGLLDDSFVKAVPG